MQGSGGARTGIARAEEVFDGPHTEVADDRTDYGEQRFRVWGFLGEKRVSLVWTPRGDRRRIIAMRQAHEQEHQARGVTLD